MTMVLEVPAASPLVQTQDDDDGIGSTQRLESSGDYPSFVASPLPDANVDEIILARPVDAQSEDTEEEVRPRKERRIKGRRRAANPLPHVESALRRQQELKTNFRTLARPLKLILREMARRATEDLENSDTAHQGLPEADLVKNQLQRQLDRRMAHINDANRLQAAYLEQTYKSEADLRQEHCKRSIQLAQEHIMGSIEQEILHIHRNLSTVHDQANQDTVTEFHPSPRAADLDEPDRRYTSHQRHAVETAPAITALDGRARLRHLLQAQGLLEDESFTVMDPIYRDLANARKNITQAVDVLLHAGLQLERDAREHNVKFLVDPNSGARGLVALADAATRKLTGRKRSDTKTRAAKMLPPSTPTGRPGSRKSANDDDGSLTSHKHSRQNTDPTRPAKRSRNTPTSRADATPFVITEGPIAQTHRYTHPNEPPEPLIKHERRSISPFEHPGEAANRMRTNSLPAKSTLGSEQGGPQHEPGQEFRHVTYDARHQKAGRPHTMSNAGFHPLHQFSNQASDHHRPSIDNRPDMAFGMDRPYSMHHHPPPPPLASPFYHRPSMSSGALNYPPPPPPQQQTDRHEFDHYRPRPMEYHQHDRQPPLPPTAQPINHFANSNAHRVGLPSMLPPLQHGGKMSPTIQSPLVALPQPRPSQNQMPYSFLPPPPPSIPPPHTLPPHIPPPMPQHLLNHGTMPPLQPLPQGMQQGPARPPHSSGQSSQYAGPTLAPAAGLTRSAQPAFAQQLDRQEQNRRRNTEGTFPRFRPYYGPNES